MTSRAAESPGRADQARQRYAFLAEASTVLATSLDYKTTLANVAELAISYITDWCVVHLIEGGELKPLAIAHVEPDKVALAWELRRRYPPDPNMPYGPHHAVRTAEPQVYADVPDSSLVAVARDAEHLRILRALGYKSYMCVPIASRGEILGALSFVSAESGRRFTEEDLALANDLARRAGIAIDNAQLFEQARQERAAAEKALETAREHQQRLAVTLEAARMSTWEVDTHTLRISRWGNLKLIYGHDAAVLGGSLAELLQVIHPDDRAAVQAATTPTCAGHTEVEYRIVEAGGGARWMLSKGHVFCGPDGRPSRIMGVTVDITERKHIEQKLREAQKLESIGLLAGGIAHDFNNLLTGILGNASLAADLAPSGEIRELVDDVVRSSERAAQLTAQLLAYAGKGRFVIEPVDLSALVRGMSSLLHLSLPKNVELRLDLGGGLPPVDGDPGQLQQVVINLVVNGAEAMEGRSGTVVVRTRVQRIDAPAHAFPNDVGPGDYVCLEVVDTGSGMSPETIGRIFDPFFTTRFAGRGLGLPAVSGIVRGHRGGITVQSAPGAGAAFRVFFPPRAGAPARREPASPAPVRGHGAVLVVDDEEIVRRTARASLGQYGYDVLAASSGADAIATFRQNADRISAVILDLTMPGMSAEDTLSTLKDIRADVPIVATSGYTELEAARRFGPGKLAGFIQKPYTSSTLTAKLQAILRV